MMAAWEAHYNIAAASHQNWAAKYLIWQAEGGRFGLLLKRAWAAVSAPGP
jgi:hypothetical protein